MKDDQRVMLTRRLLQEGLLRLLDKKDIDKITVSELCAESGVNRATFYRHYSQPRDILRNLRHTITEDVRSFATANRDEEGLYMWLENVCMYFYTHAETLRLLFKTRTDEEFVDFIQELYTNRFDYFRGNTAPVVDDDSIKLLTYCYAGGFYYLLRQWIMEPVDKTPQQVAAVIHGFLTGSTLKEAKEKSLL